MKDGLKGSIEKFFLAFSLFGVGLLSGGIHSLATEPIDGSENNQPIGISQTSSSVNENQPISKESFLEVVDWQQFGSAVAWEKVPNGKKKLQRSVARLQKLSDRLDAKGLIISYNWQDTQWFRIPPPPSKDAKIATQWAVVHSIKDRVTREDVGAALSVLGRSSILPMAMVYQNDKFHVYSSSVDLKQKIIPKVPPDFSRMRDRTCYFTRTPICVGRPTYPSTS